MKVTFTLKKDTLDIASAIRAQQTPPDAIIEASYHIDTEDTEQAFDQAAIKFATDWLTLEYADD